MYDLSAPVYAAPRLDASGPQYGLSSVAVIDFPACTLRAVLLRETVLITDVCHSRSTFAEVFRAKRAANVSSSSSYYMIHGVAANITSRTAFLLGVLAIYRLFYTKSSIPACKRKRANIRRAPAVQTARTWCDNLSV